MRDVWIFRYVPGISFWLSYLVYAGKPVFAISGFWEVDTPSLDRTAVTIFITLIVVLLAFVALTSSSLRKRFTVLGGIGLRA